MVNGKRGELLITGFYHTAPSPAAERVRSSGSITRLFQPSLLRLSARFPPSQCQQRLENALSWNILKCFPCTNTQRHKKSLKHTPGCPFLIVAASTQAKHPNPSNGPHHNHGIWTWAGDHTPCSKLLSPQPEVENKPQKCLLHFQPHHSSGLPLFIPSQSLDESQWAHCLQRKWQSSEGSSAPTHL